jgi:hypothetical protein
MIVGRIRLPLPWVASRATSPTTRPTLITGVHRMLSHRPMSPCLSCRTLSDRSLPTVVNFPSRPTTLLKTGTPKGPLAQAGSLHSPHSALLGHQTTKAVTCTLPKNTEGTAGLTRLNSTLPITRMATTILPHRSSSSKVTILLRLSSNSSTTLRSTKASKAHPVRNRHSRTVRTVRTSILRMATIQPRSLVASVGQMT